MKNIKELLSPSNVPTVREAVKQGMDVCLPNKLDDFYLMQEDGSHDQDSAIQTLSYEVADEHNISATEAEDVLRYTFSMLGAL